MKNNPIHRVKHRGILEDPYLISDDQEKVSNCEICEQIPQLVKMAQALSNGIRDNKLSHLKKRGFEAKNVMHQISDGQTFQQAISKAINNEGKK